MSGAVGTISQQSASVDFPLPTIGMRGGWRFADSWRSAVSQQLLKVKIGKYDGGLYNGAVEWAFPPCLRGPRLQLLQVHPHPDGSTPAESSTR
jgi:hypothetical protein